ncbi:protein-glutamate methylesterase/protein-glutamine glutaminase [Salirhabdus sp. Marseille-P4669]|uniref:protein-glutamate methylesterase/protein-glutamine glutaminase n=1 Tax=Salirhabdus sp. Marseille-P4669 TaxID=2042310 RepID=UPI000C79FECE|nr:chemotaxis response regulator protein-glutamate methylesterase [Salirhabdus sp. Marseille-P4669]
MQTKVLVVDDSAFMRKMITEILESDSALTVVGTARNGQDGLEKANALLPDVITLDVEMPVMNGLETLEAIMQSRPTPVLMLSSITQEGAESTIKALSLGAVDFIPKPSGPISLDIENIKQEMIEKVKHAANANINIVAKDEKKADSSKDVIVNKRIFYPPKPNYDQRKKIVAIGVSTGGPRALQRVLTKLPSPFPAPIVIVQHMPQGFTKSLAERLNKLSKIHVKEAEHGEILQNGTAYIAPGNYHLTLKKVGTAVTVFLDQEKPIGGHRPSVDYLFESLIPLSNYQKTIVVLTGMGSDGTKGLSKVKVADPQSQILAESEESAIVFGMPKSAIQTTFVNHVLHIEKMSEVLTQLTV